MAASELEDPEPNSWEELLRKMLPEGAPLPNEDELDYSISVDHIGPSPFFKPPINPIIPRKKFTSFPKQAPSLTPRNSSWLKSYSSSDTTSSDCKQMSASSIAFNDLTDVNYSDDEVEHESAIMDDLYDPNDPPRSDEKKLGITQNDCALNSRSRRCSRCGKKSNMLLKARERCIVCGSEYCKKCLLKVMGSMPEGRKCIGCIGKPIDERNRGRLGKNYKLLSTLCTRSERRRIMQVERECKANQVRAKQVSVNGRELREEELDELLGCKAPPRDLKPGRYWYDKDSGLWGKDGEKPNMIISSKLDVGGKLPMGASNGDTRVYMNGREITKVELRMLKLAKVQCPRDTHFWLYDDGSYEEEGQNNIKGYIWEKGSIRFICSLFSLAVPPERARFTKEEDAAFSARLFPAYIEQQGPHKLLLLGLDVSGASIIFKQAKLIYTKKFTSEELQNIKLIIQGNMYRYISTLLEGRERFEEEFLIKVGSNDLAAEWSVPEMERNENRQCIYSVNQKINNFSNWILHLMATGDFNTFFPAAVREYAPLIGEIWKDPSIQATYKRRDELQFLPHVAKYFLDRALEILSDEYEPSENDVLFAEGVNPSNGLASVEFSFNDHSVVSKIYNHCLRSQQLLTKYQLIMLNSSRLNNSSEMLEMLGGMNAIIFCVSLSDYDKFRPHSTGALQNSMLASKDFFERVARLSCFNNTPFLLLLTKYDIFEDKISRVPLTLCEWFSDFNPLRNHGKSVSLLHQAFHFIGLKFKELYGSLTGKKLYVRRVIGEERESVDGAFRYAREILDWEEQKNVGFCAVGDEDTISGAGTLSSSSPQ